MGPLGARGRLSPRGGGKVKDTMTFSVQSIRQSVREVVDPELGGVTIGDLGLVHDVRIDTSGEVIVELLPTFLGCPALSVMAADVQRSAVLAGAASCAVIWRHLPPWDSSLITALGTKQLASLGIAVAVEGQPDPS